MLRIRALLVVLLLCVAGQGLATIIYVNEEGTGDAPTIRAAFQMASAGDTILVGPGTYYESDILAKPDVYLHSQAGPQMTVIDAEGDMFGIYSLQWNAPAELIGFTIINAHRASVHLEGGGHVVVKNLLLYNSSVGFYGKDLYGLIQHVTATGGFESIHSGSGFSFNDSPITVRGCISAFNEGYGIVVWWGSHPHVECCDVYGNDQGNYFQMPDPTGMYGNISADPLFCSVDDDDYHLQPGSPCLPRGASTRCFRMGALGWGCRSGTEPDPCPLEEDLVTGADGLFWVPPAREGMLGSRVLLRLREPQQIRLDILDVTGRRIQSRDLGLFGAGERTWTTETLLPDGITTGIFFVRVHGRDWSRTLKVPVIR